MHQCAHLNGSDLVQLLGLNLIFKGQMRSGNFPKANQTTQATEISSFLLGLGVYPKNLAKFNGLN